MASVKACANHLAPDRQLYQNHTTQFDRSTNSVKALTAPITCVVD